MTITEKGITVPKEHILTPDEELTNAISGKELLSRLIPHVEKYFEE